MTVRRNNDIILSSQLTLILAGTMIGVGVLSLPRGVTEMAGPDGWILLIVSSIVALIIGLVIAAVGKKHPDKNYVEMVSWMLSKPIGILISIGFVIYFLIFAAVEIRVFGEVTKQYLLINTPFEILALTLLFSTVYLVRSGVECIARMAQIILPITLIISIIIILPVIHELNMSHLLPIMRTPVLKIVKSIPITFFSFQGFEMILVFSVFVKDTQKISRSTAVSIGITTAYYLLFVIIVVARFGIIETTHIVWPVLEIFKTVDIPGAFVENIDAFIMSIWILSVFLTLAVIYYGAAVIMSWIIKSKEYNYFVLPLLPIILLLSMIPDNVAQASKFLDIFSLYVGTFYVVILPILLLIISFFKKEKGVKRSG
ncbi:MAG: GerAB/ArcD/ProY family transporter [Bacillota bacterium]